MFEYVKIRDIGHGWEAFEQKGAFGGSSYRVVHVNGKGPILDGVSIGWHHLVREMTASDILRALQAAGQLRDTDRHLRQVIMQAIIEHGVDERRRAFRDGAMEGISRERREQALASSDAMQLLRHHLCEILGAEPAGDPDCPALAGWVRGTKRRATKGIFVTAGRVDEFLRDRIHEAMARAGHDPQGKWDGVGRKAPHCIVAAPRSAQTAGYGRGISRDDLLVRHDAFEEALGRAGLELDGGDLRPASAPAVETPDVNGSR